MPLAELAAVQALLLCTTGDLTVVVDNAAVVKGIRRGPNFKHRAQQHLWNVFGPLQAQDTQRRRSSLTFLRRRRQKQ